MGATISDAARRTFMLSMAATVLEVLA